MPPLLRIRIKRKNSEFMKKIFDAIKTLLLAWAGWVILGELIYLFSSPNWAYMPFIETPVNVFDWIGVAVNAAYNLIYKVVWAGLLIYAGYVLAEAKKISKGKLAAVGAGFAIVLTIIETVLMLVSEYAKHIPVNESVLNSLVLGLITAVIHGAAFFLIGGFFAKKASK